MTEPKRFYLVTGKAKHGTIAHRCPTLELALDSLRRFQEGTFEDLRIADPDGVPLTPAELEALATTTPASPTPAVLIDRV